MGGVSMERDVSLKSGKAVAGALRERGHDVTEIDLVAEDIEPVIAVHPEVAFIALHGTFGEDGGVQALLEHAGIAYTGSNAQASRAGMDKMASKCFFITHDVPTPPFRLVTSTQQWNHIDQAIEEAGLPVVVKPLRQGSSIGVTIAKTKDEVAMGLSRAFTYGPQALLERYIAGREFTVGILGDQALPVIELRPTQPFFNYEAKYVDKGTEYITRPDLPQALYTSLQELSLAAHRALDCRGYSRVDLRLEEDGCAYVLEVNTIPGFTERSLMPLAAREIGVSFPALCELILERVLADAPARPAARSGHNRIAGQPVARKN
jgi:D-alanine-D-alanine ligase